MPVTEIDGLQVAGITDLDNDGDYVILANGAIRAIGDHALQLWGAAST